MKKLLFCLLIAMAPTSALAQEAAPPTSTESDSPAAAEGPNREEIRTLVEARDAQRLRVEDAQGMGTLLDVVGVIGGTVALLGTTSLWAGYIAMESPDGAPFFVLGGAGCLACGGLFLGGSLLASLFLDKRETEETRLNEAQQQLEEEIMKY